MLKTVLVALDSSDMAERVIQTVQELILPKEVKIILCHVFPTSDADGESQADRPQTEPTGISYLQVEKQLESYKTLLNVEGDIELVSGDPSEEIIRLANIYKADLIIIGSRGLTGISRIVQRSVSSEVVEEASCSVLVVKKN